MRGRPVGSRAEDFWVHIFGGVYEGTKNYRQRGRGMGEQVLRQHRQYLAVIIVYQKTGTGKGGTRGSGQAARRHLDLGGQIKLIGLPRKREARDPQK